MAPRHNATIADDWRQRHDERPYTGDLARGTFIRPGGVPGRARSRRRADRGGRAPRVPGSVRLSDLGRLHGLRGAHAGVRRAGPGDRADRQRAQGSAVDARDRPEQRLRRPRASREGLRDRQPPPDEPRARDRRRVRVRSRRAGRALVRPLRGDPGGRAPADALDRGPRLGERRRQHARPRRHVHAVRAGHGHAMRDGGRAPERRDHAHRDGRDAGQPCLARLQARSRPDSGPALHAVELRHRHEDGRLADAVPRVLHAALVAGLERGRPRPGDGHAAHVAPRPHDRGRAVDLQHARCWAPS